MNDDQIEALVHTLETLAQTHRSDLILDTARKILALDPNHEFAQYNIILAYYNQQEFETMREAIKHAAIQYSNKAWVHYYFYLYYLSRGGQEYVDARDHIQKAIEIDPTNPVYYRSLGEIYLINREAVKAVPHLTRAVELRPTHPEYRSRLALGLLRMHKVRESQEMADQALKDGADQPWVYDSVGMIYTLSGDLDKGEELFREALRHEPTNDYFQKHIDWVLREKQDKTQRERRGLRYTPLYLRQKDTKRFFDEDNR